MKHIFTTLVLLPWCLYGQGGFTRIIDPGNPVTNFANTAAPYKGAVWIDLDSDNRPDLFVSQRFIFHNDGNGQFSQWPDLNGAGGGQGAAGSSWGDINNDGYPDAITASLVSALHLNQGNQQFTVATSQLSDFSAYSAWDCTLADADNNGRLDLLFVHANGFHTTGPYSCRLFLQQTDGTFQQVTGYEFTDQLAPYTIPVWSDFDLDGDVDLFIGAGPAGTPGADFCYRNMLKETGTFALQRLTAAPFNALQDGQTYNFPDYNNDGLLDICLTNYSGVKNRLYKQNPNGGYSSINTPFTVQGGHLANVWGDLDNDGYQDVIITGDDNTTIRYYHNKGDGTFADGQSVGVVGDNVCGIALADYDNDGDLDFYTNGASEGRALFRNDTLAGNRHWAQFSLEGTESNRSAIGTTIRVKAVVGGKIMWQTRQVSAHNSFQGQNDLRQHFGLKEALTIDSVELRWPSGRVEVYTNLSAGLFYKIKEGQGISGTIETNPAKGRLQLSPNPAGSVLDVRLPEAYGPMESLRLIDLQGRMLPADFTVNDQNARIDLPKDLPSGIYFLRITCRDMLPLTGTFVKQ